MQMSELRKQKKFSDKLTTATKISIKDNLANKSVAFQEQNELALQQ